LEGLVKHNGPLILPNGEPVARYATEGLPQAIRTYAQIQDLELDTFASLEGQIAALADDIAYNNHDIDDGFRAGFISVQELEEVPMAGHAMMLVRARHGNIADDQLVYEMNRRMISAMVQDVLGETAKRIADAKPSTIDDIRAFSAPLAQFSEKMTADIAALRRFLFAKVYKHPVIERKMRAAQKIVMQLYEYYSQHPDEIPGDMHKGAQAADPIAKQRLAGDFVAGMTDRFALQTYAKLFGASADSAPIFDATPELG
jgi:dGTPase